MKRNRLLLLLALLMTAATGAWAQGGGDAAKYTKAVAISELKVGDILAQGASITGESSDRVNLDPNRSKVGNDVVGTEVGLNLTVSFGTNGTINNQYAPVTESGQDGDAWVVTNVKNQFGIYTVNLAGILMTGSTEPVAGTYTVSMKDGVKDADKWTITPTEATTTGVAENTEVTLQYNGRLKVKGVKATSEAVAPAAKPAATVTTAPTGAAVVGVGKTTELVSGGVADGGTLWYAVTTTNTKPTSTAGFSDAVPTAKDITASGTVYVWYYVKGDDTHSDSEIAGPVSVTVAPASTPLDNTIKAWTAGTYAVPAGGLTYSDAITVSGDVTLVLTDGTTLTLNKGISLAEGATLTIQGNGTMNINGTDGNTSSTVGGNHGTLVLTSGTLTARGGNGGSVGEWSEDSHGGAGGAAINGTVIVDGGTLTAKGGNGGNVGKWSEYSHGGAGGAAISGSLTINAGTVTTTNGAAGSVGEFCEDCSGGAAGKAVAGTVTDKR